MRSLFVGTLVLVSLLAGAFYYVFYTPRLVLKATPQFWERYIKEATLSSLSIKGQSLEYPEILKLFKISAEIEWNDEIYQVKADELKISNFQTFLRDKQQMNMSVAGLNIQRKNLSLQKGFLDILVTMAQDQVSGYEGVLKNGELILNPYQMTSVSARFRGSRDELKVSEINIQAYGGQVSGAIKVGIKPRSEEMVALEFKGLKAQELQAFNKPIFSQLSGEFLGSLKITRVDGQLQLLSIMAEVNKSGAVEKTLAKRIIGYMTDEENRYAAETLLQTKGKLSFEEAQFRILNLNQNLAEVTITLNNKKENFRIHETINIDMERVLQKIVWKK